MGQVVNRLVPVPARTRVTARLMAPVGWYTAAGGPHEAVTLWTTEVNPSTGAWSLTLPPTSSYDADDTWYRIDQPGSHHACVVPDGSGPFELHDIEIPDPSADPDTGDGLPPAPAGLMPLRTDITALDARVDVLEASSAAAAAAQIRVSAVAATALSGHRVVTPRTGGVGYATAATLADVAAPLWLTTAASAAGTAVSVVAYGPVVEPSWAWNPGPVYLGTDGLLTQTVPTPGAAAFLAHVGSATSATSLFVDRHPSIALT